MIELSTPDGNIKWKLGKHLKGDEAALEAYRRRRPGYFGRPPGLSCERAHRRRDSFLALAQMVWPSFQVVRDTDSVGQQSRSRGADPLDHPTQLARTLL